MAQNFDRYNAQAVLNVVEGYIARIETAKEQYGHYIKPYIRSVCNELSIFDWWNDYLSLRQLKDMRKFLREAIKLGFDGYVCFKVGASGCSNGMWAYKEPTTTGYSPEGAYIYKSFTPDYKCWDISDERHDFLTNKVGVKWNAIRTIKELEQALQELA